MPHRYAKDVCKESVCTLKLVEADAKAQLWRGLTEAVAVVDTDSRGTHKVAVPNEAFLAGLLKTTQQHASLVSPVLCCIVPPLF